ncbi:MAG: hypothetical protein ABIH92_03765 [Nanoarchaeota archaeon]
MDLRRPYWTLRRKIKEAEREAALEHLKGQEILYRHNSADSYEGRIHSKVIRAIGSIGNGAHPRRVISSLHKEILEYLEESYEDVRRSFVNTANL